MNVLVTGSSGVIGKELVKILLENKIHVTGIDIAPNPNNDIEFIQHDLSRGLPPCVIREHWNAVFHLAAVFGRLRDSYNFLQDSFYNNALLSHHMIGTLRTKKFVFAGSYLVYKVDKTDDILVLRESSEIRPRNIVGAAKLFTEQELAFEKQNNGAFDYISARISRVYGNGTNDVIGRFVKQALQNKPLTVYATESTFDYIHARDVAMGLYKLWANSCSGIYNLGSGIPNSISNVLDTIKEHVRFTADLDDTKKAEKTVLDISKLLDDTGWHPEISLQDGIKEAIEYECKTC